MITNRSWLTNPALVEKVFDNITDFESFKSFAKITPFVSSVSLNKPVQQMIVEKFYYTIRNYNTKEIVYSIPHFNFGNLNSTDKVLILGSSDSATDVSDLLIKIYQQKFALPTTIIPFTKPSIIQQLSASHGHIRVVESITSMEAYNSIYKFINGSIGFYGPLICVCDEDYFYNENLFDYVVMYSKGWNRWYNKYASKAIEYNKWNVIQRSLYHSEEYHKGIATIYNQNGSGELCYFKP